MRWFFKNRSQNILAIDQILLHSGRVEWGDGGGLQPHYSHEKSKSRLPFRLCFCVLESELCICACVYTHVCVWWLPGGRVAVIGKCSVLLLLLLLSHFSRVRLCATPSLGFSRQEHWSGLPFPSPMHKSEKWKRSCSVMFDSSRPRGLQSTRLLRPWDVPGKSTGVGCHCLLRFFGFGEELYLATRIRVSELP